MTLGPEARAIIDAADGVDSPAGDDKERVRARLAASIGASIVGVAATTVAAKSVGAGTTVTAMAKGAGGGAVGSALLAKILTVFAVAGAVSVGYIAGRRSDSDATRLVTPPPSEIASGGVVQSSGVGTSLVGVEPSSGATSEAQSPNGATTAVPQPAKASPMAATTGHGAAPAVAPSQAVAVAASAQPAASSSAAPEGEGEAALLQRARSAIDAGDGVTALDALDAHERRFPAGLLADQRQAERVVAMCTIAKGPTTRERAEHFLAQRPRSQQADRIRRACGLP